MRGVLAVNSRLVVLALVMSLAMIGLAERPAPGPVDQQRPPAETGGSAAGLAVLFGLASACLVLAVVAVLRFRRRPPRVRTRRDGRRGTWWPGVLAVLAFLAVVGVGAVVARGLDGTSPETGPPSGRQTPPSHGAQPSVPSPAPGSADPPDWPLLALLVLLVLLGIAALAGRRPRHEPVAAGESGDPARASLARAFERGLSAVVEPAKDARTAVIRCYAALEDALTTVPAAAPHAADSASEVVDRAATAGAVRSPDAWRLVELFDEARFSPHPMTARDRADAEEALRLILDELKAAPCSPG